MGGFQVIDAMINSNLYYPVIQKSKQYRKYLFEIMIDSKISKLRKIKYLTFCLHPTLYKYFKKMKER